MPQYARNLQTRFRSELSNLAARVRKLEIRTGAIDSGFPLAALPAVIVTVTGSGSTTAVTAYLNGSATASGPYQVLASYTPSVGDNVLALPVGADSTYVIIGRTI